MLGWGLWVADEEDAPVEFGAERVPSLSVREGPDRGKRACRRALNRGPQRGVRGGVVHRIDGLLSGRGRVTWRGVVRILHGQFRAGWVLEPVQLLLGVHRGRDRVVRHVREPFRVAGRVVTFEIAHLHARDKIKQPIQLLLTDHCRNDDEKPVVDPGLVRLTGAGVVEWARTPAVPPSSSTSSTTWVRLVQKEIHRAGAVGGADCSRHPPTTTTTTAAKKTIAKLVPLVFPGQRGCRSLAGKFRRLGLGENGLEVFIAILHRESGRRRLAELYVAESFALARNLLTDDVAIVKVAKLHKFGLEVVLAEVLRAHDKEACPGGLVVIVRLDGGVLGGGYHGLCDREGIINNALYSGFHFRDGNLWLVKFNGLILQPMARTNHKFPVTENGHIKMQIKSTRTMYLQITGMNVMTFHP